MEGRAKELSQNIDSLIKYKTLFQENQDCLDTVINNLSKMGVDNPVYNRTIEIRNWTKNRIKETEKQLRKLYKERSDIWNICEHEFIFEDESYGGNYDIYVCKKCGKVDYRK
jgi:hypothetical protein